MHGILTIIYTPTCYFQNSYGIDAWFSEAVYGHDKADHATSEGSLVKALGKSVHKKTALNVRSSLGSHPAYLPTLHY